MLTVGFLAVLPNPTDKLTDFYEPFREKIVEVFKNDCFTPTRTGNHAAATALFQGPARIADVIDDGDLSLLINCDPPLWAANPPPQSQRADNFLESLQIDSWGWRELINKINYIEDEEREEFESWISDKEDAWMLRFYSLLGESSDKYGDVNINDLKIVRVITDQGIAHAAPKEAFFPPENDTTKLSNNIFFVKLETYQSSRSTTQNTHAQSCSKTPFRRRSGLGSDSSGSSGLLFFAKSARTSAMDFPCFFAS